MLTPASSAARAATLGTMPTVRLAPPVLPLLVLPRRRSGPPWPLEVSSAAGSMVAVFSYRQAYVSMFIPRTSCRKGHTVRVTAVVAYVIVVDGAESAMASSDMNTNAKPGAGTLMLHTFAFWSQGTVSMVSSPLKRPSHWNLPPRVYRSRSVIAGEENGRGHT